jgi:hypothetical protein
VWKGLNTKELRNTLDARSDKRVQKSEQRWRYTPHHQQKSAEAADSKRVDEFAWCKRVRKSLKEKKIDVKRQN